MQEMIPIAQTKYTHVIKELGIYSHYWVNGYDVIPFVGEFLIAVDKKWFLVDGSWNKFDFSNLEFRVRQKEFNHLVDEYYGV